MIFKMAGPWTDPKTKTFYLRQRTPNDLLHLIGRKVTLPVDGTMYTVTIGEVVQISLRTKARAIAKKRHAEADAALRRFWEQSRPRRSPTPQNPAPNQSTSERTAMN